MPVGSDSGESASTAGDGFDFHYATMTPAQFKDKIEEDTGLRLYMIEAMWRTCGRVSTVVIWEMFRTGDLMPHDRTFEDYIMVQINAENGKRAGRGLPKGSPVRLGSDRKKFSLTVHLKHATDNSINETREVEYTPADS